MQRYENSLNSARNCKEYCQCMSSFSENLKFLRLQRKLSQEALARELLLNRGNIASYEKGSAEPNLRNLLRILRFFQVELSDMLERDLSKVEEIGASLVARELEDIDTLSAEERQEFVLQELEGQREYLARFLRQSNDMQKILEGFRHFYQFKKENKRAVWQDVDKMLSDYEDLLEIMETLLGTNKELINFLDGGSDVAQEN